MRGAVSTDHRFLDPGSLYTNTNYIDYKICYDTIQQRIIDANSDNCDIDTFCHCWNVDLEDELTELYKPKKKLFENNNLYHDEILRHTQSPGEFGYVSHALSVKKSIILKEEYEKEHNIQYDYVILYI